MDDKELESMPTAAKEQVLKAREIASQLASAQPETDDAQDTARDEGDEATSEYQGSARNDGKISPDDYKARYAALRNKRDESKEKLQGLRERESALEEALMLKAQKIAELEAKLTNAPETGQGYKVPTALHEELGETSATALEESINGFVSDRFKTLKSDVETVGRTIIEGQRNEVQNSHQSIRETKQGRMLSAVSDMLKVDIVTLDRDAEFIKFMKGSVDPYSGKRVSELYQAAFVSGDARRMAELAKTFLDNEKSQRRDFSTKVMPDRSNVSDLRPESRDTKTWTREEIKNFYDMANRGLYPPEKIALMKQDISRAVREHRVR